MKILRSINRQPRNANQIAKDLNLDYKTVRHHLGVLGENNIVTDSGQDYGAVYCPTEQARGNWDVIERVIDSIESSV